MAKLEVYSSASFPRMSALELIDWAKACHPNVSIHAYDSTWRKFMKHIVSLGRSDVTLVFYIKDHHICILFKMTASNRLLQKPTKAAPTIYGST